MFLGLFVKCLSLAIDKIDNLDVLVLNNEKSLRLQENQSNKSQAIFASYNQHHFIIHSINI
jgi:hypothetical protein